MQHLERETIEEEGKDCQSILATCGMALQACPLEAQGVLMCPLQMLMGNMSLATLLAITPQTPTTREESTPWFPVQPLSGTCTHPGTKWWHHLPNQVVSLPWSGNETAGVLEELPHQKQKDEMPLKKSLKGDQQEAFAKDSNLVWQDREDYFKTNHPHFDCETSCNLSGLFRDMIKFANILGSDIHEIQEACIGQEDLWYANDALKTSPKGLQFFCPISPLELPKAMGLKSIHHPDALHCFAGLTFCPLCGKEGQNEGTMVNHFWTMHHKLGLVCNQSPLSLDHLEGHTISLPRLQTAQGKWHWRGRQGAWQHVHIWLTDPNHPLLPKHYPPRWQWHQCYKTIILKDTYTVSKVHTVSSH